MQFNNIKHTDADLFDDTISSADKKKIIENYNDASELDLINMAASALMPSKEIKASNSLKDNVMKQINETSQTTLGTKTGIISLSRSTWKKIASIAAVLLITLAIIPIFGPRIFNTNAKALTLLNTSIEAILQVKTMIVHFQVRSVPGDNLDLIDTRGDFIDYTLWKQFTPTEKWRIEKPGMTVSMDGQKQYRFMEKTGVGLIGSPEAGFVEWMKILLEPEKILQTEKAFAEKHKAKYSIEETNTETILTIKANALGDFKNAFSLNKSIPESDNRRVYSFDKQSGRFKSLEVYMLENNSEVLILKINSISYDETIADETFSISLTENTKWVELKELVPEKGDAALASTPEEAANKWWKALSEKDWTTVYKLEPTFEHSSNLEEMKTVYGGLQIISIGKPFRSGLFVGQYVPYIVKFKSGEVQKHNLAVRNDNLQKTWVIDGGY